jgi:hypothetical protein
MPGNPRSISLKRWLPRMSSRTIRGVHRSARISDALATGQYCGISAWRICHGDRPQPVQILNRISPIAVLPPEFSSATFMSRHSLEVTMIRPLGTLAVVLALGLGVAAAFAFDATTSAHTSGQERAVCRLESDCPERHRRGGEEVSRRGRRLYGIVHAAIYDARRGHRGWLFGRLRSRHPYRRRRR